MDAYLQEIIKWMHVDSDSIEGVMVINKQGIIEYYKNYENNRKTPESFEKNVIGRHLLEVYPELNEENSTVMRTLRTGTVTVGERQRLVSGNMQLDFTSTTYPILDEQGEVQGAIEMVRTVGDPKMLDTPLAVPSQQSILDNIVTQNQAVQRLKNRIRSVAKTDSPVLIYGETGTGKELFAEALHELSGRKNGRFMAQNCAAIPSTLLESIFFGTEKGGFTGAEFRKGLFELADGGTLFLDEINSMDATMQAKLLKALEEKKVRRIGGREDIQFDVRVICASNEDPELLLQTGRLRSDFYYRVGVVQLRLPPLRERPEDIILLADYYIRQYNEKMGKQIQGLSLMAKDLFVQWSWPGNIRELKNVIEGAFNVEESPLITLDSVQGLLSKLEQALTLPAAVGAGEDPCSLPKIRERLRQGKIDLKQLLEQYEAGVIQEALNQTHRLNAAADKLSMSPQKLQYRMEKLGLKP